MYLVDLPEGKKDVTDLSLAYSLGHSDESSRTEILKHEGYTLVLKSTLEITLSNDDVLTGSEAFDRVGHGILVDGMESVDPSAGYRVTGSPWFHWEDEDGNAIQSINTISRHYDNEMYKLEVLLEDLFG